MIKATEGVHGDHSIAVIMDPHQGDTMMVVIMATKLVHQEADVAEAEEAVAASDEVVVKTKMMVHSLEEMLATTP